MPGKRHTKDEVARRRARVAEMVTEGFTRAEIAAEVGVTTRQVRYDLAAARKSWVERQAFAIDEALRRELDQIYYIEEEARKAWEESRQPVTSKRMEAHGQMQVVSGEGKLTTVPAKTKKTETSESSPGDPRFLAIMDRCVERRLKIYELLAPLYHHQDDEESAQSRASGVVLYLPDNGRGTSAVA